MPPWAWRLTVATEARMKVRAIRISDRLWDEIRTQAAEEGVSASDYVRESVLARLFYDKGHADGYDEALEQAVRGDAG